MKRKGPYLQLISALLMVLWVYTALSKWVDIGMFKSQLHQQPLPDWSTGLLVWLLPAAELTAAGLLMFERTRSAGLLLSFSLLLLFTGYVAMAVLGYWKNVPCSCGGVLNTLGWKEHLWFNLFFTAIAAVGVQLSKLHRKGNLQQDSLAGEPAKADNI